MTTTSSRRLSTYEYFENLQLEYLVCRLRARIYPKPSDKDYWNRTAEHKKEKFCGIAERNFLQTILTDSDLKEVMERNIFRNFTYPLFLYKDEIQKQNLEYTDLLFYYSKGSEIRILCEGDEIKIGKIEFYKPFSKTLTARLLNNAVEIKEFEISKCSRIL